MLNKEEIKKAKEDLMFFNEGDYITREMDRSADIIEEYIDQLEQENNKQNKIIDEMAKYMSENMECDFIISTNEKCANTDCKDCFKQYFEKKVEEK